MPKGVLIDETGNVYGRWTVIKRAPRRKGKPAIWICCCACGKIGRVAGTFLRWGGSKSCGCLREYGNWGNNLIDLTGKRFGKLVVIKRAGRVSKRKLTTWECKCDCGKTAIIVGRNLRKKTIGTKSCGCLANEGRGLPAYEASFNGVMKGMIGTAKRRGKEWNLSREEVKDITSRNCYYCGASPSQGHRTAHAKKGMYVYNGIDRVNNLSGYVSGNVVPCCNTCNSAKGTKTLVEFRLWIMNVYNNFAVREGVH